MLFPRLLRTGHTECGVVFFLRAALPAPPRALHFLPLSSRRVEQAETRPASVLVVSHRGCEMTLLMALLCGVFLPPLTDSVERKKKQRRYKRRLRRYFKLKNFFFFLRNFQFVAGKFSPQHCWLCSWSSLVLCTLQTITATGNLLSERLFCGRRRKESRVFTPVWAAQCSLFRPLASSAHNAAFCCPDRG